MRFHKSPRPSPLLVPWAASVASCHPDHGLCPGRDRAGAVVVRLADALREPPEPEIRGNVWWLARDAHGSRALQRFLEHAVDDAARVTVLEE